MKRSDFYTVDCAAAVVSHGLLISWKGHSSTTRSAVVVSAFIFAEYNLSALIGLQWGNIEPASARASARVIAFTDAMQSLIDASFTMDRSEMRVWEMSHFTSAQQTLIKAAAKPLFSALAN